MQVAGYPVCAGPPAGDATDGPAAGEILLTNVASVTVNYNVNQQPFSMAPKYTQTLPANTAWIADFDRGGGNGPGRYELTEGCYEFTATSRGWELYKKSFDVKLDNTGNRFAFNYVLNNRAQTLASGQAQNLAGEIPPFIRFENGRGQYKEKKLASGSYKIAVGADKGLDMFPADAISSPAVAAAGKPPAPPAPQALGKPSATVTLPAGFNLFDPVAALTARGPEATAQKLPANFTLFAAVADARQSKTDR
jgi:hypothetical protein